MAALRLAVVFRSMVNGGAYVAKSIIAFGVSLILGLCLFGRFKKVVRLHEKQPGALSVADRPRFFQVFLGFAPQ